MIPNGIYDATIVPASFTAANPPVPVGWAVNLRGSIIAAAFVGPYTPTHGDNVRVSVTDGVATVLGCIHAAPPAAYGTVVSTASGIAQVSTESGTISARYTGTAPTNGSFVRLNWSTSMPWIEQTISAIPASPWTGTAPAPPPNPLTGVEYVVSDFGRTSPAADPPAGTAFYVGQGGPSDDFGRWNYPQEPLLALAGKTITSVHIFLPRATASSVLPFTAHVWSFTGFDAPAGANETLITIPAGWSGGWVSLPIALGNDLKDGGYIGLRHTGGAAVGFLPPRVPRNSNQSPADVADFQDARSGQLAIAWSTT